MAKRAIAKHDESFGVRERTELEYKKYRRYIRYFLRMRKSKAGAVLPMTSINTYTTRDSELPDQRQQLCTVGTVSDPGHGTVPDCVQEMTSAHESTLVLAHGQCNATVIDDSCHHPFD